MSDKKNIFIIAVILVISLSFYWFEYRPLEIKKSCSWVVLTESKYKKELKKCDLDTSLLNKAFNTCESENKQIISEFNQYKEATLTKEKEYIKRASEVEYELCLRDRGLKK